MHPLKKNFSCTKQIVCLISTRQPQYSVEKIKIHSTYLAEETSEDTSNERYRDKKAAGEDMQVEA